MSEYFLFFFILVSLSLSFALSYPILILSFGFFCSLVFCIWICCPKKNWWIGKIFVPLRNTYTIIFALCFIQININRSIKNKCATLFLSRFDRSQLYFSPLCGIPLLLSRAFLFKRWFSLFFLFALFHQSQSVKWKKGTQITAFANN